MSELRGRFGGGPRPRLALAIAAIASSVVLAACGDDDSGDSLDEGSREAVIESGRFNAQAIYDKAAPGVVTIRSVIGGGGEDALFGGPGGGAGQGSGFVVSKDGEVVTNAHVITDAEAAGGGNGDLNEAKEVFVEFADRNQVPAEIVGFDPFSDVGLIKVDPDGLDLESLEFASGEGINVGEPVAAIGSPFGEERSLSIGVISATGRSVQSLTDFQIDDAIQTDASINPGNSGGPLLDAEAKVIGINQQINTASGGSEGVGFAVPVTAVRDSVEELRDDGEVDYAFLGVTSQPLYPQLADELEIDSERGALIAEVTTGGPADDAGLEGGDQQIRFQGLEVESGGDVIVAVDGEEIVEEADLPRIISHHEPGDTVTLEVLRDGETDEIEVELGERPSGPVG